MGSQLEKKHFFFSIFSQPQEPAVSEEDQKPPEDLLPEEEIDKPLDNLFSSSTMNDDLLLSLDESKQPQRVGSGTFDDILKSFGGEGGAAGKNIMPLSMLILKFAHTVDVLVDKRVGVGLTRAP